MRRHNRSDCRRSLLVVVCAVLALGLVEARRSRRGWGHFSSSKTTHAWAQPQPLQQREQEHLHDNNNNDDCCRPCWTTTSMALVSVRGGAADADADAGTADTEEPSSGAADTAPAPSMSTTPTTTIVLRIRLPNGSIERVAVQDLDQLTLQKVLAPLLQDDDGENVSIQLSNGTTVSDTTQSLSALGLKHGSLLTVVNSSASAAAKGSKMKKSSSSGTSTIRSSVKPPKSQRTNAFDPFPTLAKGDYELALWKAKRSGRRGGSYAAMATLQAAMHAVEPQPEGKLFRVYMCSKAAARFQSHCIVTHNKGQGQQSIENRCGLLLGTVVRERKKARAPHTSLSSTTEEDQYGRAARVHALWEPPAQKQAATSSSPAYDRRRLAAEGIPPRVRRVSDWLGLQPVGWIFTYDGTTELDRTADDALPVLAPDVHAGATLQIRNMQYYREHGENNGSSSSSDSGTRFVTLAMDASSGATEAFQLSDVSVQMVAEDLLEVEEKDSGKKKSKKKKKSTGGVRRYCPTRHPIIVDGKETQELDSVLCLVNTALLSHEGLYSAATATTKKKTGSLTAKARKSIIKALEKSSNSDDDDDDDALLATLSDFATLVALDELLGSKERETSRAICQTVRKYARGQKRTTALDPALKQRLRQLLVDD